jgi:hypothetical protein
VGPAGQLLRHALAEAGFDESAVYLTNAVKHFKWVERGKRRIHERPKREEILACRMWLEEEIRLVKPAAIVALGATAAGALLGPSIRVTRDSRPCADVRAGVVRYGDRPSLVDSPGARLGGTGQSPSGIPSRPARHSPPRPGWAASAQLQLETAVRLGRHRADFPPLARHLFARLLAHGDACSISAFISAPMTITRPER